MSGINGDKARFHRRRKQKIARRIRTRELLSKQDTGEQKAKALASDSSLKAVSA
jgi:hypothetical protein